eukprot:CAMPEP_0119547082 /NCGR_PEP_ID=MMETSP1352-20130426/1302_1 /TAXON_ID=265584 /ORGANISM="Stauroneis constricta, Strain CCMP1120" /LENGTH=173 /DNA_ID=CAMNT_0007591919 /DNA_START=129 /DNA_END=650 /DNA_ORIENTATION=-
MTKYVTDVGGNIGDSQAAKLGTHFSLMMLIEIPTNQVDVFQSTLKENMQDMNASIYETTDSGTTTATTPQIAYRGKFYLKGADNPGIVHKVTSMLSKNGLSVDKMETSESIAPYGGTMLFKMKGIATAAAPLAAGFDVSKIQSQLAELGDDLNCDITLEDSAEDEFQGSFYAG